MATLEDLFAAVQANDGKAVGELLAARPDLARERTETGRTAFLFAIYFGATKALEVLRSGAPALDACEAAAAGDDDRLRQLAKTEPAQLDSLGADGASPLHFAAYFGHDSTVRLLLDTGASVHLVSTNENLNTPLHAAIAGKRSVANVTALLDAGGDPNGLCAGGYSPLHLAAARGDIDLIELLSARGARPCATDDGKWPVDLAREHEHLEAVTRLEGLA